VHEAEVPTYEYFVDESGTPDLFGRGGRPIPFLNGNSRTFMLGAAVIQNYAALCDELAELRHRLIRDPRFAGVPSFNPSRNKTARLFHAKNDLPSCRIEVFNVLDRYPTHIFVVLRRKEVLAQQVLAAAGKEAPRHSWQREYDSLVKRLFHDRLHLARESVINFAKRGNTDRQRPLSEALAAGKKAFERKWERSNPCSVIALSGEPINVPGLQVVDYYLWALQRVFERDDWSHFLPRQDAYRLIIDSDDRRRHRTGEYYSNLHPLTQESIMPFEG